MAFSDQQIINNTGTQLDSFIYHLWMRSLNETPAEQALSAALAPLLHEAAEICMDPDRPFPSFAAEIMPKLRAVITELNAPSKQPLSQIFRAARDNDAHILGMMLWRINDRAREWRNTGLQAVAQCGNPENTEPQTPAEQTARPSLSLIVDNTRKPQP